MPRRAGCRARHAGASCAGSSRGRSRAARRSTASRSRPPPRPAIASSCGAAGASTGARGDEPPGAGGGIMRRALVTLGHPDHAGMLRALKILDDAAAARGWELRFVLAAPHPLVATEGLPVDRIAYLPALRRWR